MRRTEPPLIGGTHSGMPARIGNTAEVEAVTLRDFGEGDRAGVIELWRSCGLTRSWNDPNLDIDRKVAADDGGFFIAVHDNKVLASVMAGYDGHRGWINYLAVDPKCQGDGVGRLLMERAEQHLLDAGCPKINLQIRADNSAAVRFYERLGYSVDDVVSMGKRIVHDVTPER